MACGLSYLHSHENIVHGNLTSSNVLLDENTNAKIADFSLSPLMTTAVNSKVIATAGALGYRAPELLKLKKANTKTDVYSLARSEAQEILQQLEDIRPEAKGQTKTWPSQSLAGQTKLLKQTA
ncbi:unnamed protein product [Lupinus luteus]|uniref:Protein kinase domain-containing protein n=1 Tax=Lupinus luteus TaxID=3873 RepID=A0AAV1W288_LUPLU